jgi:hypothetical protein
MWIGKAVPAWWGSQDLQRDAPDRPHAPFFSAMRELGVSIQRRLLQQR